MSATLPKTWNRTSVQNLVRHKSGRYYARTYAKGKESWKSLRTDLLEVAKVKLRSLAGEIERSARAEHAQERGKMTVGECAQIFLKRVNEGYGLRGRGKRIRRISGGTQLYRRQTLVALWRSWPELDALNVRRVSEREVEDWSQRFAAKYSPTRYNNTLDTLRALFRIAVEAGARLDNPAANIGRLEVRPKTLTLPEREQFVRFVEEMRKGGSRCSQACADLVELLAYTGARKTEAANILWSDVDFVRGRIHLRVTKGGQPRFVPLIADARRVLERLHAARDNASASVAVLEVRAAPKAMDRAAKKIGMSRITHHDLRHLFATTCIEAGVDIPTVSRWMGHRDGGALAMRTYGHLRDDHSLLAARKVSFASATP